MKLEKTRENIAKNYNGDEVTENVTEIVYKITDDGQQIGDARAYQGSYNININGNSTADIADSEKKIKAILGIED
jgi:hypothetical protein